MPPPPKTLSSFGVHILRHALHDLEVFDFPLHNDYKLESLFSFKTFQDDFNSDNVFNC